MPVAPFARPFKMKFVTAPQSGGKKERLVQAAKELFHEQTFGRTTLADVARRAKVPVGNVYYYFKTKEALAHAVIDHHREDARGWLQRCQEAATPSLRLLQWTELYRMECLGVLGLGCPLGTLLLELKKVSPGLADEVGAIFVEILDWMTAQFQAARVDGDAFALACTVLERAQGISTLGVALGDKELANRQFEALQRWLAQVTPDSPR